MPAVDEFWKQLEQLKEKKSMQDLLQEPLARVLAAGALGLLLVLLYLNQPKAEAETKGKLKQRKLRGYTRAQVAQHMAENDLWLIISHKTTGKLQVYDVTSYIEHHPGGDAIFTHAGSDCTEGFRGPQHPPTVEDLVEEYCIGWVED